MRPKFVLDRGASITWMGLFFRTFLPPAPLGAAGAARRAALVGAAGLDWGGPAPFVAARGGRSSYVDVSWQFQPGMAWVFDQPDATFWSAAIAGSNPAMRSMDGGAAYEPGLSAVYTISSFAIAPAASVRDATVAMDANGCFGEAGGGGDEDEALIFCPYSFKDSLKNPWLKRVYLFHDIGLDRLVNTYRDPVIVTRAVTFTSCRGSHHVMDLDNVTSSVVVGTKGVLTFDGGSKAQNMTNWPSKIPLLLSAFRVVDNGVLVQRNTTMRIRNMGSLVTALGKLPHGFTTAPDVPDLQPTFLGGAPPTLDSTSFVIQSWQLDSKRYAAWTRADTLPTSIALWSFTDVTVQQYVASHCYRAALLQARGKGARAEPAGRGRVLVVHAHESRAAAGGAGGGKVSEDTIPQVSSGRQLLDALANEKTRYIQVVDNISLDPSTPPNAATVGRIVEGSVAVTGNLIFNGDIIMTGLGWGRGAAGPLSSADGATPPGLGAVVGALSPRGPAGIVEFEDLSLTEEMGPAHFGGDSGQAAIRELLALPPQARLDSIPANLTLSGPQSLLLRTYFLNGTSRPRGATPGGGAPPQGAAPQGTYSFLDTTLEWSLAQEARHGGVPVAAYAVPLAVAVAVAALLSGVLLWRRHRRRQSGPTYSANLDSRASGPSFLGKRTPSNSSVSTNGTAPRTTILTSRLPSSTAGNDAKGTRSTGGGSGLAAAAEAVVAAAAAGTAAGGREFGGARVRGAPPEEILEAYRNLVGARPSACGQEEEMQLLSVLGEGAYGKASGGRAPVVYKGRWRGTVVAIKVMILPAAMSGKERREKMAVMETAISSSLSHPNIVQTFTYSIRGVNASDRRSDAAAPAAGPAGAGAGSPHDSSGSLEGPAAPAQGQGLGQGGDVHSWELRLVLEFCDLGSLREALNAGTFKANAAAAAAPAAAAVGHEGAGAGGSGGAGGKEGPAAGAEGSAAAAPGVDLLHSILHSDLKARNILLKSSPAEARGFVAKVADFGLSMEIDPQDTHISGAFQGTITHMVGRAQWSSWG
ncbi:hypothetical protein MNEG_10010 [Monoraphidium neglectum]|uniref:Protein kinase domain-containing protein n=1 Tax=Monoraphidium neglectum TaxID=145388 RepID=A0A0D2JEE9_9CHLO|nr:hypothetical protein MNEG_10010 [Monoraphidium neglectum]KIY97952.1 hypothetical protein MNEG_10010 [Monoraphidium neglectum]|eukprot:XP_013896972.1 hypothetical protein MNEG_10010 [Monoraphidium neglectum]